MGEPCKPHGNFSIMMSAAQSSRTCSMLQQPSVGFEICRSDHTLATSCSIKREGYLRGRLWGGGGGSRKLCKRLFCLLTIADKRCSQPWVVLSCSLVASVRGSQQAHHAIVQRSMGHARPPRSLHKLACAAVPAYSWQLHHLPADHGRLCVTCAGSRAKGHTTLQRLLHTCAGGSMQLHHQRCPVPDGPGHSHEPTDRDT